MLSLIHAMFVAGAVSTKSGLPREEFETGLPSSGKYFFARFYEFVAFIIDTIDVP